MTDEKYMKIALNLVEGTIGQTSPNPAVGAVLVKENQIIGVGAHLKAGTPHAEVYAIQMAGHQTKDSTLYITLEPCNHFGSTPPCTELIISAGIKKVFIASVDPNPIVSGKGIETLKKAGVEVEVGLLQEEAQTINKYYFHNVSNKLPFVTIKSATSLDGKISTASGESKWITGNAAREDGHKLRHEHDAILVGINTIIKDNPKLTTRLKNGGKSPIRIILDSHLKIPTNAKVITDRRAETWIITVSNIDTKKQIALENAGIKIVSLKNRTIEVEELLKTLWELGIRSLLVEGGAEVNASFLNSGFIQQIIVYLAPKIIGGNLSLNSFAGKEIEKINESFPLSFQSIQKLGEDYKVVALPQYRTKCKSCKKCKLCEVIS